MVDLPLWCQRLEKSKLCKFVGWPELPVAIATLETLSSLDSLLSELPIETQALAGKMKSLSRRAEFVACRWLFAKASGSVSSLGKGDHGEPMWPPSWSGSLTHKDGTIGMTLLENAKSCSVGIDLEGLDQVGLHLASRICPESTKDALSARQLATIFSLKEALFKAVFPVTKVWFYFEDAEVQAIDWMKGEAKLALRKTLSAQAQSGQIFPASFQELPNQLVLSSSFWNVAS